MARLVRVELSNGLLQFRRRARICRAGACDQTTLAAQEARARAIVAGEKKQSRTGLSIAKVVKQLRPLRSATININGAAQTFPPAVPDVQHQILTDLGIKSGY